VRQDIANYIIDHVEKSEGCKSHHLLAQISVVFINSTRDEINEALYQVIRRKDIFEIEYVIKGVSRSFLLPRYTQRIDMESLLVMLDT